MSKANGRVLRVLSIDNGGVRGIIPAMVLAEIEKRTGHPVCELFDFIAGTGSGGITALMLSRPVNSADVPNTACDGRTRRSGMPKFSAQCVADAFRQEARRVYPSVFNDSELMFKSVDLVCSLTRQVACPKYPARGLERFLATYLEDLRLRDCLVDVLIPCFELDRRLPFMFKSSKARAYETYDFLCREAGRAATACPVYFDPACIDRRESGRTYTLVDGSPYASNPAMCAYAEARRIDPDAEIFMVSLGAGLPGYTADYEPWRMRQWGLAEWARPLVQNTQCGLSESVDYQVRQLLAPAPQEDGPERERNYYRLQVRLDRDSEPEDNVSCANMRRLELLAENLIEDNQRQLKQLCDRLVSERGPVISVRQTPAAAGEWAPVP